MLRRMINWVFQSESYSGIRQHPSNILCPANNSTPTVDYCCWYVSMLVTIMTYEIHFPETLMPRFFHD
jgi:hypothetical protein